MGNSCQNASHIPLSDSAHMISPGATKSSPAPPPGLPPVEHSPSPTKPKNSLDVRLDAFHPNPEIGAYLKTVPLFGNKLTDEEFDRLGGAMESRDFVKGSRVIVEGDEGDEFFVIFKGEATVSVLHRRSADVFEDVVVAPLGKGDFFGEAALLANSKRTATVTATTDLEVLVLPRTLFSKLFDGKRFIFRFAKRGGVVAEKITDEADSSHGSLKKDKSEHAKYLLSATIMSSVLFKNFDAQQLRDIVDEMHQIHVKAGTELIKQGAVADNFYVVESGEFDVLSDNGTSVKVIATRGPGSSFGELALLYNSPRAATVVAKSDAIVWAIDRKPFRRALTKGSRKKLHEYERFLTQVSEFSALSSFERSKIAESLEEVSYPANHVICKQGDAGDTFYLIKSGSVAVSKVDDQGVKEEVGILSCGNYFGELALRHSEPRAATVTSLESVVCLTLDHHSFIALMGPLDDVLEKHEYVYHRKYVHDEEKHDDRKIQKSELSVLGTLGKGSFGFVQLVKDREGRTYALKGISKVQIIQTGQIEHVLSEKHVMNALKSPFLVRLFNTFKDQNAIYFLLEPCLGGELFTLLRHKHNFSEQTAQFYAACVIEAFEFMHSKNTVHRDLKPENLLLDNQGYVKLTDFGFAKIVTDRTFTLCGTPDYLAPEVVSGQGHGKGVDWWTLGILIYEMIASYPPFYDEDPMRTYAKIMHGRIAFPKHFSPAAVDLISKLLNPKPTKRLGVINGGVALIKGHPWFHGFNWDALAKREMKAPLEIKIKGAEDLTHFQDYIKEPARDFPKYVCGKEDPNWDAEF